MNPASTSTPPPQPVPKEELSDLKSDPVVGKYAVAAMGVPHASVQAKMRIDAVEQDQVCRVLRALGITDDDNATQSGVVGPANALATGPGGVWVAPCYVGQACPCRPCIGKLFERKAREVNLGKCC